MKETFIYPALPAMPKYLVFFGWVLTSLCLCPKASAQSESFEPWHVTGFGTLGYAQSSKYSDLILKRNITQRSQKIEDNGFLVDSRLGLQASKTFLSQWDVVTQLIIKEKVYKDVTDFLTMAFVRYQFNPAWSVRVGRMVFDSFLLSDHRNVGYSYHWVRPPTEFYGWIPYDHYDGIEASFELGDFERYLRLDVFTGRSAARVNIGYGSGGSSYSYIRAHSIIGVGMTWETGNLALRAYSSQFKISDEIALIEELKAFTSSPNVQTHWPQAKQIAQDYGLNNTDYTYNALAFSWETGTWLLQGELSDVSSSSFGTYGGQRGYIHVARRFGPFLPHVSYSRSWDDTDYSYDPAPATPSSLPAGTFESLEVTLIDNERSGVIKQYTISVGIRWDFASQKALKVQCDRTTVKEGSLGIFPTPIEAPRILPEATRTWCSTTFDWLF
jgi:hypothetical protein